MSEYERVTKQGGVLPEESVRNVNSNLELRFYDHVRMGAVEYVSDKMDEITKKIQTPYLGVYSDDPVRNIRYHVIEMAVLTSHFCLQGGMDAAVAYNMADAYIRQADKMTSERELIRLIKKMMVDFTKKMKQQSRNQICSKNIMIAIDYIQKHMYEKVTAVDVARRCELNPSYLSRLFKEEMGMGLSEYIRCEKIGVAKHLLKYTEESLMDIANALAFSSQSHFGKVFHDFVGMTPKEYRDKYFYRVIEEVNDLKKEEKEERKE